MTGFAATHTGSLTPSVQIARGRQASPTTAHAFVDMLTTSITIDVNEYDSKDATTPAVVNASNAGILTGDLIRFDVDVTGTGSSALFATCTFGAA